MAPYNPPMAPFYFELKLSPFVQLSTMLKVIGKEGNAFKAITHQSGSDYIWWNKDKNVIEIWAYSYYVALDAFYRVAERYQRFENAEPKIVFGTFDEQEYLAMRNF